MEKAWVDFRAVKAALTMQMILDRYGVVLKRSGQELRGKCPIHRGSNNKHFTVNLSKNVFKCFSETCGAHGNILDFVAAMERCSVRDAAIKISEWFKVGESAESSKLDHGSATRHGIYRDENAALYEIIGTAIDWENRDTRVVYRELFGDFRLCVGPMRLLQPTDASAQASLTLLKML